MTEKQAIDITFGQFQSAKAIWTETICGVEHSTFEAFVSGAFRKVWVHLGSPVLVAGLGEIAGNVPDALLRLARDEYHAICQMSRAGDASSADKSKSNPTNDQLIDEAAPFCEYGPNYNRHIHTSSAHLRSAIARGHSGSVLDSLVAELKLRLEYWASCK